jgi:hypothetical protein
MLSIFGIFWPWQMLFYVKQKILHLFIVCGVWCVWCGVGVVWVWCGCGVGVVWVWCGCGVVWWCGVVVCTPRDRYCSYNSNKPQRRRKGR